MSNQILNHIVLGRETTWGTPVTPDKTLPVNFTGGIQTVNDVQLVTALKSKLPMNYDAFIGNRTHEGDYEMGLYPDWIGYLALSAMGAISTTEPEAGVVYEHTFTEAESKIPLTVEQKIGDNVRRYAGVIVQQFGVSMTPGEIITVTANVMGKSQAFEASPVTPAPTSTPVLNFANAQVSIDGSPVQEVQNLEVNYTNNLGFKHTLNSNDPQYIYLGGSQVTGSLEMYLDSTTLAFMNNYLNKDFVQIELAVVGTDTIGASSNYEFHIDVPKAVLTTGETPLGDNYNILNLEFEGIYDSVTDKLVSYVLRNLTPDYT